MPAFEIAKQTTLRTCVVRLSGDIDTAVVPELKEQLGSALSGGCNNVVLDLSEVVYADSSALGLLVWLDHRLGPGGGRLVLAGANPDVERILELSGLVSFAASIGTSADVGSALAGLQLKEAPTDLLWHQEFEMAADVNNLAGARESVSKIIEPLAFAETALFDIKVALGEAMANAIRHGSSSNGDAVVQVEVFAYADRVVLEVRDSGRGFDGTASRSEDMYAPGGRGIMFMRALMDRVEFETPDSGGTRVRLVKHRNGGEG
jgi:stage II sporulation protein AA (anti-sigma F factor antagonist)